MRAAEFEDGEPTISVETPAGTSISVDVYSSAFLSVFDVDNGRMLDRDATADVDDELRAVIAQVGRMGQERGREGVDRFSEALQARSQS